MLSEARRHWAAGECFGFPRCCRARFIVSQMRPRVLSLLAPGLASRLAQLSPRMAVADGLVPCEYHLARWLLTGVRADRRAQPTHDLCCDHRQDMADVDAAHIARQFVSGEDPSTGETVTGYAWFLTTDHDDIQIDACPWCGTRLEAPC